MVPACRAERRLAIGAAAWTELDFALLYCLVSLDPASAQPRSAARVDAASASAAAQPAADAATSAPEAGDGSGHRPAPDFVAQLLQRGGFSLENKDTWDNPFVERDLCRDAPAFRRECERLARCWYAPAHVTTGCDGMYVLCLRS